MQISEDLIRQTIAYLEANAFDEVGQTLLKQLQFVLEVNEEAQVKDYALPISPKTMVVT